MNKETFIEYKNSFSYGSRTDLSFKFLAQLSEEEGAIFFQQLIEKLGDTFDDGDVNRLIEHVVEGQIKAYDGKPTFVYDDGPFASLKKPISEMRFGLLTSTGHFVAGEDPEPFGVKDMSQTEATERIQDFLKAAPELSEIPLDIEDEQLMVRHGGYDIRGVIADRNVALPIDHMRNLEAENIIGTAVSPAYSFVGAAAQRRLLKESIPGWIEEFQKQQIEGAILVPV